MQRLRFVLSVHALLRVPSVSSGWGLCAQAALDIMSDASDSVNYIMGGMTVGTAILGTLGGGE